MKKLLQPFNKTDTQTIEQYFNFLKIINAAVFLVSELSVAIGIIIIGFLTLRNSRYDNLQYIFLLIFLSVAIYIGCWIFSLMLDVQFGKYYDIRAMRLNMEGKKAHTQQANQVKTKDVIHDNKKENKNKKQTSPITSNYLDVVCPNCSETLSFTEEYLEENKILTCPHCYHEFKTR